MMRASLSLKWKEDQMKWEKSHVKIVSTAKDKKKAFPAVENAKYYTHVPSENSAFLFHNWLKALLREDKILMVLKDFLFYFCFY